MKKEKVFFSGINGIGMSSIALILNEIGYEVAGSDLEEKNITRVLKDNGIKIFIGQKEENLKNDKYDTYIYSTAIKEEHPEYSYAKKNNIKMFQRGAFLAKLFNNYSRSIAVAGTHGKTTTSSMMSVSFLQKSPFISVGGIIPEISANYKVGSSEYFIAEADESDNSFLHMNPYYSVITNIEADHLDFHKNFDNIKLSFKKFIEKTKNKVVACYDCEIIREISKNYNNIVFYSANEENKDNVSIYAKNIRIEKGISLFEVIKEGKNLGLFKLSVPGIHNISNALSVIYLAEEEKLNLEIVKEMLFNFKGANRRYQVIYDKDFKVIDDYAHHPTEIKSTISAAKMNEDKEIVAIFQPHRYSRTKNFLDDFADSLKNVSKVIILPIYAASEENIYNISSENLVEKIGKTALLLTKEELFEKLKNDNKSNKVYIFMGAGSISSIAHEFVNSLDG